MKAKKNPIYTEPLNSTSEFEWSLFKCPEDQEHWCDIYEHARDNPQVLDAVKEYREKKHWPLPGMFLNPCHELVACRFFDAFPEFPAVPFLSLPEHIRRSRCAALNKERSEMRARHHPALKQTLAPPGMHLLEITQNMNNADWSRIRRLFGSKAGRQRSSTDRLRDLSIIRLYRKCSSWENVEQFLDEMRIRLFSDHHSQLSRGATKAIKDIETVLRRVL